MSRRLLVLSVLIACVTFGTLPAQDKKEPKKEEDKKKAEAIKKERQRLQGSWQVVEFVTNGEAQPDDAIKDMRVVFAGDKMTMSLPKNVAKREYTFTLDPTQTPKAIDTSPADPKFKVKTPLVTPGIYQVDGAALKLCLARFGGKVRPREFESAAGTGNILITLKRAK